MSEFIVLGLIPGTHIAISFALWLLATCLAGAFIVGRVAAQSRALRAWIITARVAQLTRRRLLA